MVVHVGEGTGGDGGGHVSGAPAQVAAGVPDGDGDPVGLAVGEVQVGGEGAGAFVPAAVCLHAVYGEDHLFTGEGAVQIVADHGGELTAGQGHFDGRGGNILDLLIGRGDLIDPEGTLGLIGAAEDLKAGDLGGAAGQLEHGPLPVGVVESGDGVDSCSPSALVV